MTRIWGVQALAGARTDVNVADSLFNGVTLLDVDAEVDDAINVIETEAWHRCRDAEPRALCDADRLAVPGDRTG